MRKESTKGLYTLLGITLFLAIFNAAHVSIYCIGGILRPENWGIQWLEHDTWMQYTVLIGRMIGGLAFSAFLTMFIYNTSKAAREGILFPKKNFGVLIGSAISLFVYRFFYDNMELLSLADDQTRAICVSTDSLLFALIIVAFALMYRIASKVSEENNLTI